MPRIIQKYIRNEILSPFLLSLFVFTLVLFMQSALDLSDMIISRGMKFSSLLRMILYTLPSLLWISVPMAFLMATLIGLGRLSTDNEIIALHTLGVGKWTFLRPVMSLGMILFLLCFTIGNLGVPWGRSSLNQLFYTFLKESATAGIQARIFNDGFADLIIYSEDVNPRENRLTRVMIADYRGENPETIMAHTGTIWSDPETYTHTLKLTNGSVHQFDAATGRYRLIHFQEYQLFLSTDVESARYLSDMSEKSPSDLSLSELRKAATAGDPLESRRFQVHYQEKIALPFSCVVFGLFSIPFGIRFKRSGKFVGFTWSLCIVFLYYILLGIGRNFGTEGLIPPFLAAWLPNLIFGVFGVYLFFQTSRRMLPERSRNNIMARIKRKIFSRF